VSAERASEGDLAALRTTLGASTVLWAGQERLIVEPGCWQALSGARSVDFNVVACHDGDVAAAIARGLEVVADAAVPAVIMVAGRALAAVQLLVDAGWVCIGATPFMMRTARGGTDDPCVRKLGLSELAEARALVAQAFDLSAELSVVALPDRAGEGGAQEAWGLYEDGRMVTCVGTVTVDLSVAVWSMATPQPLRRRGYGGRLLSAVLARKAAEGVVRSLLYASEVGEPLYHSLGYDVLEHWQMWSRPRWVLGRA